MKKREGVIVKGTTMAAGYTRPPAAQSELFEWLVLEITVL